MALKDLPLLAHLVYEFKADNPDVDDQQYIFLVIQHLLRDAPPLVRNLLELGCTKSNMHVIGVWYSTDASVVEDLRSEGVDVHDPSNDAETTEVVERLTREALEECENTGKRLIVVEDGGYIVPLLHEEEFRSKSQYVVGAVEQTTRGIWKAEAAGRREAVRRVELQGGQITTPAEGIEPELLFPLVSIPDCELKRSFEPAFVAEAFVACLSHILLNERDDSVRSKNVALLGYGAVGSAVAGALVRVGASVTVWDRNVLRRVAATAAGFSVATSPGDAVREAAIIIGATGAIDGPSISQDLFHPGVIRDRSYLASASSRQEEIDIAYLKEFGKMTEIPGVGASYVLDNQLEVIVLADGTPLNFFNAQSAGATAMQLILGLLWDGARLLTTEPNLDRKILRGADHIREKHLAELWLKVRHDPFSLR